MDSTVNNELKCSFDEGFHIMDKSELMHYFTAAENRWGIYDKERHIIISVAWTNPGFLNLVTDAKTILSNTEMCLKRNLKSYKNNGKYEIMINDKKAKAFRFEFMARDKDVMQSGEYLAFRMGKKFYIINSQCRTENTEACSRIFADFLKSISFLG